MTSKNTLNVIEFDKILNIVSSYAISNIGKEYLLRTAPTNDVNAANNALDLTYEAFCILYEKAIDPIDYFDDIEQLIQKQR